MTGVSMLLGSRLLCAVYDGMIYLGIRLMFLGNGMALLALAVLLVLLGSWLYILMVCLCFSA